MMQLFVLPLFLILVTALAQGAESKILFKNLPAPVQQSAQAQSQGVTVRGYSKEIENGKTFYEVQTVSAGKSKDILLDATGAVVEVEQALDLSAVPAPVMDGLRKLAGPGKLASVESVTKGSAVSYEAVVARNGKKREIAVDAAGAPQKP